MSKSSKSSSTVSFPGFFKLTLLYGLALGQLAGIAYAIAAFCGAPVQLSLGDWKVHGIPAGLSILMFLPVACGIASVIIAPALFLPFTFTCRILGGFKVARAT